MSYEEIFHYKPSKAGAIIAGLVNVIVAVGLFIRIKPRKDWWGLCVFVGSYHFALGFFIRQSSAQKPNTYFLFVGAQVILVVFPATFLAFNYIVYGRLVRAFANGQRGYSLIRSDHIAKIFIACDVVSVSAQGIGAGMFTKESLMTTGRVIFLIGIIAQGVSYLLFCLLVITSQRMFCNDMKYDATNFPWRLFHVLYFSSICILIRTAYRAAELAQGNDGYLITHEVYFYVLDVVPLVLATAIYAIFWPGILIEQHGNKEEYTFAMGSRESPSP